jgi:formylglycine-generating enzyme required for sulfatase activity
MPVNDNGEAATGAQRRTQFDAHGRYDPLKNENRTESSIFLTPNQDAAVFEPGTHVAVQHDPGKRTAPAAPQSAARADPGNGSCVDCPEMIPVPGKKFALAKYTVTFGEWDACVSDGGCGGYQPPDSGWGRGNRPVINVSWNDAQAYIQWLSRKTGNAYRLPTAEEWEMAARAGTTTNYYWGNDVGRNNANCDGCGSEWDNRKTAPVGSFKPNAFGLYDMMGNVWQWTDSCWKDNCSRRLFVGGSWNHRPEDMRATTRNWFETGKRMRYLGFRLGLTLP